MHRSIHLHLPQKKIDICYAYHTFLKRKNIYLYNLYSSILLKIKCVQYILINVSIPIPTYCKSSSLPQLQAFSLEKKQTNKQTNKNQKTKKEKAQHTHTHTPTPWLVHRLDSIRLYEVKSTKNHFGHCTQCLQWEGNIPLGAGLDWEQGCLFAFIHHSENWLVGGTFTLLCYLSPFSGENHNVSHTLPLVLHIPASIA